VSTFINTSGQFKSETLSLFCRRTLKGHLLWVVVVLYELRQISKLQSIIL